jgi:hypothetical protein
MKNRQTGYVLLRVDYDPATHDLVGITSRFEGGQGCLHLTVQQVDTPDQTKGDAPFIAY